MKSSTGLKEVEKPIDPRLHSHLWESKEWISFTQRGTLITKELSSGTVINEIKDPWINDNAKILVDEQSATIAVAQTSEVKIFTSDSSSQLLNLDYSIDLAIFSTGLKHLVFYSEATKRCTLYNLKTGDLTYLSTQDVIQTDHTLSHMGLNEAKNELTLLFNLEKDGVTWLQTIDPETLGERSKVILPQSTYSHHYIHPHGNHVFSLDTKGAFTITNRSTGDVFTLSSSKNRYTQFCTSQDGLFSCLVNDDGTFDLIQNNSALYILKGIRASESISCLQFVNHGLQLLIADCPNKNLIKMDLPVFHDKSGGFFPNTFSEINVTLQNPPSRPFANYRLQFPTLRGDITKNAPIGIQLSEIKLFEDKQDNPIKVETVTSQGNSPKGEDASFLFDGNVFTKYFNFTREESQVDIVLAEPKVISTIEFTSANDFPRRDPVAFSLIGVTENGEEIQITTERIESAAYKNELTNYSNFLHDQLKNPTDLSQYIAFNLMAEFNTNGAVVAADFNNESPFRNEAWSTDEIERMYYWHSYCLNRLANDHSAYQHLQELAKLKPQAEAIKQQLGVQLLQLKLPTQAKPTLQELSTSSLENLCNYMYCLLAIGDLSELEKTVNKYKYK